MKIVEVTPKPSGAVMPGADFADAWRASVAAGQTAEDIVQRLPRTVPGWVSSLLDLRNLLVRPFGLRTDVRKGPVDAPMFPVIASQPDRVVLGLDDRHLDFRLVIEIEAPSRVARTVTATTYVHTNNFGGQLYLALVKPFHRIIVPVMLRRAIAAQG